LNHRKKKQSVSSVFLYKDNGRKKGSPTRELIVGRVEMTAQKGSLFEGAVSAAD